jgi:hypothetical protein
LKYFKKLGSVDVSAAVAQIDAHPELWNQITWRSEGKSPHRETQDIWVRNRKVDEIAANRRSILEPHLPVFYPAWEVLTELHPIVFGVIARHRATCLGHILITRIPEGCQVYPHHDRGSWHSETMDFKVWIPLKAPAGCVNTVEDEAVVMRRGEIFTFDNMKTHGVKNFGPGERQTLIISLTKD